MDEAQLMGLLDSVARSPDFVSHISREAHLEVARNQALLRSYPEIESALRAVPELLVLDGLRMGTHGHCWRIDLREICAWLLREAIHGRTQAAVAGLSIFAASRQTELHEFVLLSGLTCTTAIEIVDGLEIVPFAVVPKSWATRQLETDLADRDPNWKINPEAAVLRRRSLCDIVHSYQEPEPQFSVADQMLVALALTVGLGHPVMERGIWTEFAAATPLSHRNSWITQVGHEVYVTHRSMPERQVTESAVRLAIDLLTSTAEVRRRMAVPLQRYRLALLRRSAVDAAIELGVAFEASVIEGRTKKDLTSTGAFGVVLILGGDKANRDTQYSIYEQFYDNLRSPAVHTGFVDESKIVKIRNRGKTTNSELLQLAKDQCRLVLETFIKAKALPDWNETFPSTEHIAMTADAPKFQK